MIYVVSGLPRSGTSMLMKMLDAAGMEIVTDNLRKPDDDNPVGYFEYEPVKKMAEDTSFVHQLDGKAVKVISHLLKFLPPDKNYKIIFMLRSLEEVLLSQKKMLERSGEPFSQQAQENLYRKFQNHLYDVRLWIARQPHFECLYVKYPEVIADPLAHAKKITQFLDITCNKETVAAVVSPELYRNKISNET